MSTFQSTDRMSEPALTAFLHQVRHVQSPCPKCQATGGLWYGSTSTWRGGVGGCAMTWDICDACWGSGDAERPWANLRAQRDGESDRVHEAVWSYFASGIGTELRSMAPALEVLAGELEKLAKGRKARPDSFYDACKVLSRRVRAGLTVGQQERFTGKAESVPSIGQLRELWEACVAWKTKADPICHESIYQSDRVNLACPELAEAVMKVLGYAKRCDVCGEKSDVDVWDVCDECKKVGAK